MKKPVVSYTKDGDLKRSNTFQEKVISSLDKPSLSIPGAYGVLVVVQSLSSVRLSVTPWAAAHQASWSFTISWSPLKLMSIESEMPYNHLILCCPLLLLPSIFPSIRLFSNEMVLESGGQSIGPSASASVLPMEIQSNTCSIK